MNQQPLQQKDWRNITYSLQGQKFSPLQAFDICFATNLNKPNLLLSK